MRIFLIVLFVASILFNVVLLRNTTASFGGASTSYPLLSPRIFVQSPNDIIINFTGLRSELRSFIGEQKNFRPSVYFEYLPSGVSIGVNEKEEFISASLLKTPFIMGVFRLLETGALQENDLLTLRDEDLDHNFGTLWKRGAGAQLTIGEAIRIALTQSDNTAARALDSIMSEDLVRQVYDALDVPVIIQSDQPVVSPKNYSSIFRCLYLSCFLTFESSHRILELLTQTVFTNGIPGGVPRNIPVSHKVGIYDAPESTNQIRTDCGIVFVPKRPYILCIFVQMEQGVQEEELAFVRDVSRKVYSFVTSQD